MDRTIVRAVLALAVLLPLASAVQSYESCDNTGRYCFAEDLYDCAGGKPVLVEHCSGPCTDTECVDMPIAPDIKYEQPVVVKGDSSSTIGYTVLAVLLVAIFVLYLMARWRRA